MDYISGNDTDFDIEREFSVQPEQQTRGVSRETAVANSSLAALSTSTDAEEMYTKYLEGVNIAQYSAPQLTPYTDSALDRERALRELSLYQMAGQIGVPQENERLQQLIESSRQVDMLDVVSRGMKVDSDVTAIETGQAKTLEENPFDLAAQLTQTQESLKALDNSRNAVRLKFAQLNKEREDGSIIPPIAYEMGFYFIPMVDGFMTYAMSQGLGLSEQSMGFWRTMKSATLPGEARHELKEFYESLSNNQKVEFNKKFGEYLSSPDFPVIFSELGLNNLQELYDSTTSVESETLMGRLLFDFFGVADLYGLYSGVSALGRLRRGSRAARPPLGVRPGEWVDDNTIEGVFTTLNETTTPVARSPKGIADATNKARASDFNEAGATAYRMGADDVAEGLSGRAVNPRDIDAIPTNGEFLRDKVMPELTTTVNFNRRVATEADPNIVRAASEGIILGYTPDEVLQMQANIARQFDVALNKATGIDGTNIVALSNSTQIVDVGDAHVLSSYLGKSVTRTGSWLITPEEATQSAVSLAESRLGRKLNASESAEIRDGSLYVQQMLNDVDGGWTSPTQALNDVKFALRDFGVTDQNLRVYRKNGSLWEPFNATEHPSDGQFMVGLATRVQHTLTNVDQLANASVRGTLFDRIPTLSRLNASSYLLDTTNRFERFITQPLSVGVARADRVRRMMVDNGKEFIDSFKALDADRRAKVVDYIEKANLQKLPMDRTTLAAEGFTQNEMQVFKNWKRVWDTNWELENRLLRDRLNKEGYRYVVGGNIEVFGRPVSRNSVYSVERVYDPITDAVVDISRDEIKALYDAGGEILQTRRPLNISGQDTNHVAVKNNADYYSRKLTDGDQVLNYIPGYYTRSYRSGSKFIDATSSSGVTNTVAVAKDSVTAQRRLEQLQQNNPDLTFRIRNDRSVDFGSDAYFDELQQGGRLAQRYRGQVLQGALVDEGILIDPFEAMNRSIRSISEASVMRREIDNIIDRTRVMYEDLLPRRNGQPFLPSNPGDIVVDANTNIRRAAELRSYINLVNMLSEGYANGVDDILKAASNNASAVFGEMALRAGNTNLERLYSGAERFFSGTGTKSLSSFVRGGASTVFIGWNPLRQLLLQPAQSLQMIGVYPQGFVNGSVQRLAVDYMASLFGRTPNAHTADYIRIANESGLFDGVDAHLITNKSAQEFANYSNELIDSANNVRKAIVDIPRKVGMELGETMNRHMHLMVLYQRAVDRGVDLSNPRNVQELIAETQDFMGNLHRAAPLTYNSNSMSILAQFMQVPHKISLAFFNRNLSGADRAKLIAANVAIYGLPLSLAIERIFGLDLFEDRETRAAITMGLLGIGMNAALGQDLSNPIDTRNMSPLDGWINLTGALDTMNESIFDFITKFAPVTEVGRRLNNIAMTFGSITTIYDEYDHIPVDWRMATQETAKLASGLSNAMKAYMMYNTKYAVDNQYRKYDYAPADAGAAIAQAFGLPLRAIQDGYEVRENIRKMTDAKREDIRKIVKEITYRVRSMNDIPRDNEEAFVQHLMVTRAVLTSALKDDPEGQRYALGLIRNEMSDKSGQLYKALSDATGLQDIEVMIKASPLSEEQKRVLLSRIGRSNGNE